MQISDINTFTEDLKMKKVVLLGDSIRLIGYGLKVGEMLGDEYEVWQPEDNCRFSKYTLLGCEEWAEGIKDADVIHWNNGLWDVCNRFGDGAFSSKEEYVANILRIARILMRTTKNIIFATTTPVHEGQATIKNEVIDEYNEAAVSALSEIGVKINDLNAFVRPCIFEYVREDDKMHLTDKGIDAAAREVAQVIKATV